MFVALVAVCPAAELRGRVTNASDATVAGAKVALSGPVKRTATTDSHGDYRFTGLPAGRYSLFAGAPQLVLPKAIPVTVGPETVVVNLELRVSSVI